MKRVPIVLDNEKNVSELSISPDGRVFAFGASRGVLEVLSALEPHDQRIRRMLDRVRGRESSAPTASQHVASQPVTGDA